MDPQPTVRAMCARKRIGLARAHAAARSHEFETPLDPDRPRPEPRQTKTRSVGDEPGCASWTSRVCARETNPASTVLSARAEVRFALRIVALVLITRFLQEASAGRNLITLFHSVNNPSAIFFSGPALECRCTWPRAASLARQRSRPAWRTRGCVFLKSAFFQMFFKISCLRRGHGQRPRQGYALATGGLRTRSPLGEIFFLTPAHFATQHVHLREIARPLRRLEPTLGALERVPKRHRPHEAAGGETVRGATQWSSSSSSSA